MGTVTEFNPLDWMLALLFVHSTVRAMWRGFFREACALVGLCVGFLLACWNFQWVSLYLLSLVNSPQLAQMFGFLLIIFLVMLVAALIGKALRRSADAVGLGFADRVVGGVFGLLRGLALGVALLLALAVFLPASAWLKTSVLAPYFLHADHALSFVMPDDLEHRLVSALDSLKHKEPGWIKSDSTSQTESEANESKVTSP